MESFSFIEEKKKRNELLNSFMFVDYDNLYERLKDYNVYPAKIKFFETIFEQMGKLGLNPVSNIVYANFDSNDLLSHQTYLQNLCLDTRHSANQGKNSGDLELTVDACSALYKNSEADVFTIVSNDRDIIPLLKIIRSEGKMSLVITTKKEFNMVVANFADKHLYIEDLFNLTEAKVTAEEQFIIEIDETHIQKISDEDKELSRTVSSMLFSSGLWKKFVDGTGQAISLIGYTSNVAKGLKKSKDEVSKAFQIAHALKFVTIYKNENDGRLYIRDGENKDEVVKKGPLESVDNE